MKAEILSIGSELTSGKNLDTNSQWLSQRLAEMGLRVHWHTTVADDLADNVEAFRIACRRAQVVIASGGLGPTQDDLTREVLAQVAAVDLVFDQATFDHIAQLFSRRNRVMPERNRAQAYFPAGSEIIPNANGTAPGIWMKVGEAWIAALPGVPSEMFAMFANEVKPRLLKLGIGGSVEVQRKINAFGTGESHIEEKLLDLTRRDHVPEVGITVSDATISLRIFARAPSFDEAQAQIAPIEKTIRDRLGNLVFGVDDEELHHVVARMLADRKRTVATAESITGGLVAQRLSKVPGASHWLRGGVVTYATQAKMDLLDIPAELIATQDVISAEVVEAMAAQCRRKFRSDFGVSTVGLAGPGAGGPGKPVGLVYVGLAWEGGVKSQSFSWAGSREEVQSRTAKLALNQLRLFLLEER